MYDLILFSLFLVTPQLTENGNQCNCTSIGFGDLLLFLYDLHRVLYIWLSSMGNMSCSNAPEMTDYTHPRQI